MNTASATKTLQDIANEIIAHVNSCGKPWSSWYVGIASDPGARLFTDHKVSTQNGAWIYRDAGSEDGARKIEKYLLDTYSAKGDTGGGDSTTTWVYAYYITSTTVE